MDPRSVSTLRNLRQALIRQTLRLHYSKVNVTLICEDAAVSRTAFYRHFRNIDELLDYTFYFYLDELEPLLLAQTTLAGEARVLYAFISEHEDLFRAYIRIRGDYPGDLRIDKRLKAMIGEHFVHRLNRNKAYYPPPRPTSKVVIGLTLVKHRIVETKRFGFHCRAMWLSADRFSPSFQCAASIVLNR